MPRAWWRDALAAPFIYGMVVPIGLLDLTLSLYQAICFRLWRVPQVRRRDYIRGDRAKLDYLTRMERLNCAYCDYANGIFAYAREVGARTEQYWCPIKNARKRVGAHERYANFIEAGDRTNLDAKWDAQRNGLCSGCRVERACAPARHGQSDQHEPNV